MPYTMRRGRQALSADDCAAILAQGSSGVLALQGDEPYPYAVPLNYVFLAEAGGRLYFHCARQGHKLDALRHNPRASFCVVAEDHVVPEAYTTYFRSVIVFGQVRELVDEAEKRAAILALAEKYHPAGSAAGHAAAISKDWAPLCMLEMTIDHCTGKEAIELTRARQEAEGEPLL